MGTLRKAFYFLVTFTYSISGCYCCILSANNTTICDIIDMEFIILLNYLYPIVGSLPIPLSQKQHLNFSFLTRRSFWVPSQTYCLRYNLSSTALYIIKNVEGNKIKKFSMRKQLLNVMSIFGEVGYFRH